MRDHPSHPLWKTVVRWAGVNLASELVCTLLAPKRTMRLRYCEDFVADPKAALGKIGSLVELDLTDVADAASSGKPMQPGHNIGGNRTKKATIITLRSELAEEWKTALSTTEQRFSWRLLGWLFRRYGYDR